MLIRVAKAVGTTPDGDVEGILHKKLEGTDVSSMKDQLKAMAKALNTEKGIRARVEEQLEETEDALRAMEETARSAQYRADAAEASVRARLDGIARIIQWAEVPADYAIKAHLVDEKLLMEEEVRSARVAKVLNSYAHEISILTQEIREVGNFLFPDGFPRIEVPTSTIRVPGATRATASLAEGSVGRRTPVRRREYRPAPEEEEEETGRITPSRMAGTKRKFSDVPTQTVSPTLRSPRILVFPETIHISEREAPVTRRHEDRVPGSPDREPTVESPDGTPLASTSATRRGELRETVTAVRSLPDDAQRPESLKDDSPDVEEIPGPTLLTPVPLQMRSPSPPRDLPEIEEIPLEERPPEGMVMVNGEIIPPGTSADGPVCHA